MDQTRLDAIRARCEAATPGPWKDDRRLDGVPAVHNGSTRICDTFRQDGQSVLDAEFIAHARTDVPDLCDDVERLTADLAAMTADRDAMREVAVAAEADLKLIAQEMFSDNSEDLDGGWYPCEVCKKYDDGKDRCWDCFAASYDESKPGVAFEWRGPVDGKEVPQ